jgi:hypothetical protein
MRQKQVNCLAALPIVNDFLGFRIMFFPIPPANDTPFIREIRHTFEMSEMVNH